MEGIRKKGGWIVGFLALVALADFLWIFPANQTYAKRYLNESIVLSASTYATCRIINGGVSSLQESSISISPWGVGLEYEAGQILDPINDAVERLSEACVHSMALLGAQRIVLGIINSYGLVPFYLFLLVFIGLALWGRDAAWPVVLGAVPSLCSCFDYLLQFYVFWAVRLTSNILTRGLSNMQANLGRSGRLHGRNLRWMCRRKVRRLPTMGPNFWEYQTFFAMLGRKLPGILNG